MYKQKCIWVATWNTAVQHVSYPEHNARGKWPLCKYGLLLRFRCVSRCTLELWTGSLAIPPTSCLYAKLIAYWLWHHTPECESGMNLFYQVHGRKANVFLFPKKLFQTQIVLTKLAPSHFKSLDGLGWQQMEIVEASQV